MEYFKLSDGRNIGAVMFGCYNAKGGDNYQMFKAAIDNGYRYFDTASVYETERDLGRAIKESGIDRSEFFIQSKLWIDEMGYENAKKALERSLNRLNTDYIDIYLIHWPRQIPLQEGAPGHPDVKYNKPEYVGNEDYKSLILETYRALEELYDEGKIKGIGLSNFLPHHMLGILDNCKIMPLVDQLEFHVGYTQWAAVEFAKKNNIVVEAWSPLARGGVFEEPFFVNMAQKYNVSTSKLALRFIYQAGVVSLPKSGDPDRQIENMNIFDFEISDEDFYVIACMVPTCWQNEHPDFVIPSRKSNFEQ